MVEILLFILGGVGAIITLFVLNFVRDLKLTLEDISRELSYYHPVIVGNPAEIHKEYVDSAIKRFRELSTELRARVEAIPFYSTLAKLRFVPALKDIDKAAKALMYLHNTSYKENPDNWTFPKRIRGWLHVRSTDTDADIHAEKAEQK